jgi:hypothetical protein
MPSPSTSFQRRSPRRRTATIQWTQLAAAVTISGELRALADELLDRYVSAARQQQRSWSDIGVALGVSKQAAQQRFATAVPDATAVSAGR